MGGDEPMCTSSATPQWHLTPLRHRGIGMPVLLGAIEYSTKHSARWITPAPDRSQPWLPATPEPSYLLRFTKSAHRFTARDHVPVHANKQQELAVYQHLKGYTAQNRDRPRMEALWLPKTFHVKAAVSSSDLKHLSRFRVALIHRSSYNCFSWSCDNCFSGRQAWLVQVPS
ncbi:hypothetical protein HAX54_043915 [Datura stramonium]|uniref:Uncharacterized protein n=1 Tax=Datura stramonium TaxID=4076 RepID=A0ABS8W3R5_DATST|nr:hypothetical protein [Datura stramonium]